MYRNSGISREFYWTYELGKNLFARLIPKNSELETSVA